jgi:tripartite ATP-independent transporter DctP family solute receptor
MSRLVRVLISFVALALVPAAAWGEDKTYTLQIATVAPNDSPWADLLKKYKKDVEQESGGKIKVKLFLGGTLGDENETVLKCKRGQIEAVGASTGAIASQVPEVNVVEIPYLFRSADEADYIIDNVLTAELEKVFPKYGLVLGFWSENGFRHFGTKDKFVKKPADLKGKIMRSQESPVHLAMYRAWGASPNAIPTTEVLTALQNGTVDGFDQSTLYTVAASWYKSAKYFTVSAHIYQPAAIVFNQDWFNALPADLQKVVVEQGRKLQSPGRKGVRDMESELLEILKEEGIQVYTLTAAEREVFETAAASVRTDFRKTQGKTASAMLDLVEKALAKYRK